MNIKLSEIAKLLSLELKGEDQDVKNLSIDSREVKNGDLFVAIKGDKHDGHDFIQQSIKNGASSILCNDKIDIQFENEVTNTMEKTLSQTAKVKKMQQD